MLCAQSCSALCNSKDIACQAPLPTEFCRQEYWSGLPFLPPGDLLDPGIKPESLVSPALMGRFSTAVPPGQSMDLINYVLQVIEG